MKNLTEEEMKNIKVDFRVEEDRRCVGEDIVRELPEGAECIGTYYESDPCCSKTTGFYKANGKIYSQILSCRYWSLD